MSEKIMDLGNLSPEEQFMLKNISDRHDKNLKNLKEKYEKDVQEEYKDLINSMSKILCPYLRQQTLEECQAASYSLDDNLQSQTSSSQSEL